MQQHIQIIGCGNIGKRVAHLLLAGGIPVSTTVNSQQSQRQCEALGLTCNRLNLDQAFKLSRIQAQSRILYTIPPPPTGTKDIRLGAFLGKLDAKQIDKFVLISTTGVYGDCAGNRVNEEATINPKVNRAKRRADAEQQLQAWSKQNHVDHLILRVPGIYSLDRLPLKRLQAGTPMVKREDAPWSNRIHADDLASACYAALICDINNEIINISDDEPGTMTDYFNAVADYAVLPRPPQISLKQAQQNLSAGMLSYLAESPRPFNSTFLNLVQLKLLSQAFSSPMNTINLTFQGQL